MDWKKLLPLIGLVLLIYVLWRFDIGKILSVFSSINPFYAALCFLGIPVIFVVINIECQMVFKRQRIHVSFLYSLKNLLIGYFYGFITPGGLGAFLRALYLKHESKAPLPKCLCNLITFNTIDYISIFILGSIGGLFLLGQYPVLYMLILALLFIMIFLFFFFFRQKTSKHLFQKLIQTQLFQIIQQYMQDPMESFYEDLPSFRSLLLPFLFAFFGWIVFYTELYLIALFLFHIHIPYITFVFMLAVTSSLAVIPISVYGLGTRDAIVVALFSVYNVPPENSISFTLFWFTLFFITPSIIGAFITVWENKKLPLIRQEG